MLLSFIFPLIALVTFLILDFNGNAASALQLCGMLAFNSDVRVLSRAITDSFYHLKKMTVLKHGVYF